MRLTPRPEERRPDPPALRTDDLRTVMVGTAVWALLFVLALVARPWLVDTGRGWWVWTPLAGALLGLCGLRYVARRDAREGGSTEDRTHERAREGR